MLKFFRSKKDKISQEEPAQNPAEVSSDGSSLASPEVSVPKTAGDDSELISNTQPECPPPEALDPPALEQASPTGKDESLGSFAAFDSRPASDFSAGPDVSDSSGVPSETIEAQKHGDPAEKTESEAESEAGTAKTAKKGFFGRLKNLFSGSEKTESGAVSEPESESEVEEAKAPEAEAVSEVLIEARPEGSVVSEIADMPVPAEPQSRVKSMALAAPEAVPSTVPVVNLKAPELGSLPQVPEVPPATEEPKSPAAVVAPAPEAPAVSGIEEAAEESVAEEAEPEQEVKPARVGWFRRLKERLSSTRARITERIETVLSSVREINEDVLEELEEILITSDMGVKTSQDLLFKIRGQVKRKELKDSDALKAAIKERLLELINLPPRPLHEVRPQVIMVVGVNGVGKTTTIAKLARRYQEEGRKVLLAAGDTFRAAAVEQLTIWAERLKADIVSQPTGADASAVVFDALSAAKARDIDVVIVDTAGRLHTKVNLMDELKKIKRVANKAMPGSPHETVLVLDANTGQNAASQARTFHEAVGVDSLIITKLDGTSKGGVVVSIINELKVPVTFIGLGEKYDDLRPFQAAEFVEAIMES
ncbi:MAG: signal recognition particle-docking protein FtsY [Deltaproteobacteria bacterium]|jgi:fused signal recognition particle receptor|nr:signal recognition particle-docking protein FtsY [Deltaproteobacteria bacterium]